MPSRLQPLVLVFSLLMVLTACVQTSPSPLPTPAPTIDLPENLVNSRWQLVEIAVAGQEVDVEPIRPVYLTMTPTREQPNSMRVEFQSECYENQESPRRLHYIMQFSSSHQFAFDAGLQMDHQCDLQRRTYDARFIELSSVPTSYALEDGILVLRGTEEASGEEIVMTWERSPVQPAATDKSGI